MNNFVLIDDAFGLVRVLSGTSTDLTELGIQMHTVSISQYTTYEKRLQTFQNWPKNLKQTPETLAAAGFYYQGQRENYFFFLHITTLKLKYLLHNLMHLVHRI